MKRPWLVPGLLLLLCLSNLAGSIVEGNPVRAIMYGIGAVSSAVFVVRFVRHPPETKAAPITGRRAVLSIALLAIMAAIASAVLIPIAVQTPDPAIRLIMWISVAVLWATTGGFALWLRAQRSRGQNLTAGSE